MQAKFWVIWVKWEFMLIYEYKEIKKGGYTPFPEVQALPIPCNPLVSVSLRAGSHPLRGFTMYYKQLCQLITVLITIVFIIGISNT